MDEVNKKVEDIFSEIDKTDTRPKVGGEISNYNIAPASDVPVASNKKIYFIVVIAVLVVAAIVAAIFLVIKAGVLTKAGKTDQTIPDVTQKVAQDDMVNQIDASAQDVAVAGADNSAFDSDSDGLFNDKEKELGTNSNKPDTDNDGLFDGEEVDFYKTDPLKSDTDGDGYLDGEEVKGGYNPRGPGQLLNFEEAKKALDKK